MPVKVARVQLESKRGGAPAGETEIVHFELSLRSLFVVLAFISGVWLLIHLLPVLLVLVTALMLVGALSPLVTWLEEQNVRRTFALCTVFGFGLAAAIGLAVVTLPPLVEQ